MYQITLPFKLLLKLNVTWWLPSCFPCFPKSWQRKKHTIWHLQFILNSFKNLILLLLTESASPPRHKSHFVHLILSLINSAMYAELHFESQGVKTPARANFRLLMRSDFCTTAEWITTVWIRVNKVVICDQTQSEMHKTRCQHQDTAEKLTLSCCFLKPVMEICFFNFLHDANVLHPAHIKGKQTRLERDKKAVKFYLLRSGSITPPLTEVAPLCTDACLHKFIKKKMLSLKIRALQKRKYAQKTTKTLSRCK